jgi:hypothetical protein
MSFRSLYIATALLTLLISGMLIRGAYTAAVRLSGREARILASGEEVAPRNASGTLRAASVSPLERRPSNDRRRSSGAADDLTDDAPALLNDATPTSEPSDLPTRDAAQAATQPTTSESLTDAEEAAMLEEEIAMEEMENSTADASATPADATATPPAASGNPTTSETVTDPAPR